MERPDLMIAEVRASGTSSGDAESGWRKLANGRMAHVSLSRGRPSLYLPLDEGRAFLLALREPEGLLETLRARSRRAA